MAEILIVEDDSDVTDLLRWRLERDGHRVIIVTNAWVALALARQNRPDVAVLDLPAPGMPKEEMHALLRHNRETARIPILVISTRDHPDEVNEALAAGADDFLAKPFSPRGLGARVNELLSRPPRTDDAITAKADV